MSDVYTISTPDGDVRYVPESRYNALAARLAEVERERDAATANGIAWIKQNGPGGWIDELRQRAETAEAALKLLTNRFKYSTEVVTIANAALSGARTAKEGE